MTIPHIGRIRQRAALHLPLAMLVVGLVVLVSYTATMSRAATGGNVAVDFGSATQSLPPYPFSGTISTYGTDGGSITASAEQRTRLGSLGPALYRLPLQYNGGSIISSAGGGPTNISGDTWVNQVKSFGGVPMIVLGGTADNNFTASDAANMVRHFNTGGGNRVDYWVVGNEPGNGGMSVATYCSLFNSVVPAMKAVDPTIKVAGPAWAYYDQGNIQSFLNCAGATVDVIDYHHYGMGSSFLDTATALAQTGDWETEIRQIRQMINATVPGRAAQIEIQVGEYNWSWRTADGYPGYNGDDRFYQASTTVWGASVAGHIAAAGARGHQYSDQNGGLGLTFERNADAAQFGQTLNDPMPIYYGLRMFMGGSLFRGFGSQVVAATTTLPNVEVFASNNSQSIVLINKSPTQTQTAAIDLTAAAAGTADIWQTNKDAPFAEPVKTAAIPVAGQIPVTLPAYTVTTIVLGAGAVSTTADLNGDTKINVYDLSIMLGQWGTAGTTPADLNHDSIVSIFDLSMLLTRWSP